MPQNNNELLLAQMLNNPKEEAYWSNRYKDKSMGWDIGYPSTPLVNYIDQLSNKEISILVPGAGNGYEVEYLWNKGFVNVHIMDISEIPLKKFRDRNPTFPEKQILHQDFFKHKGQYDLILEQTFFCSLVPTDENRNAYVQQMTALLRPKGKLVGLWFDIPLSDDFEKRPFGGDKELYLNYLTKQFKCITFERCYNSIPERQGIELFGIFVN